MPSVLGLPDLDVLAALLCRGQISLVRLADKQLITRQYYACINGQISPVTVDTSNNTFSESMLGSNRKENSSAR
jgi:hypothetical protein